jgi:exonuclease SbcC
MSGPIPSGIIKEDGTEIPIDLLSTGTGDGTAIALRLAMAEHLLQDRKGFMIMDDPLVNLDPERRKAAAEVLRDFAGKFQLIVTTCDPNTAGLLGGNLIEI